MQQHIDLAHSQWQHIPSSLAEGPSPSVQRYGLHYDSPRGAKRSRSKTFSRESDMDIDPRRLRPTLPHLSTSSFSGDIPTPPLSASSSLSSAGSSLASYSSFPRSFSACNWQPSSAGLLSICTSPEDLHSVQAPVPLGRCHVGNAEIQAYSSKGFATPALPACEPYDLNNNVLHFAQPASYPAEHIPTPPPAPTFEEQHLQLSSSSEGVPRDHEKFVEDLVGTSMLAIDSIWASSGASPSDKSSSTKVLPLKYFIRETLRRSRSGTSTLQVALYYLHRSRVQIRERVLQAERAKERFSILSAQRQQEQQQHLHETGYPTPPGSPSEDFTNAAADVLSTSRDPVVCGRRMFLAALISASKFLQDRNYSNRAWSKLSGLPVTEVNANERAFLDVMGYELFIKPELFQSWCIRLQRLASDNEHKIHRLTGKQTLERTHSDYLPAPVPANNPMGSLGSGRAPPIAFNRAALARSMTEMDVHRRRASTSASGLPGFSTPAPASRTSPLPTPRRASDAFRHTAHSVPRLITRPSGLSTPSSSAGSPFPRVASLRPAMSRRMSSSECRQQYATPPWPTAMQGVC